MRVLPSTVTGLLILFTVSAQAVPTREDENWRRLPTAPLSLSLGDRACGEGLHQALWRDWRGEW